MTSKLRAPGLYEFLQEAELQHYYNGLKNILQVQNVGQLKYVVEDDLHNIGMSKPECRRLKTYFYKYCPGNYASKLRRLLLPGSMSSRREEGRGEYLLGEEQGVGAEIGSRGAIKVPTQHVIPADAISIYKELGQGEFGVVQQGVWTDDEGMRHQVAVKCLSKERMQNNTLEFMKEYEIMQSIDHNHIVRLYGVILDAAQIMLITELAPLRSLLECLKEPSLRTTFTVPCLADFCLQICQGMTYVESKRLIHRDLAARNILVFSKNTVKISDFGLSRALGVGKDYYQTNFNVNLKLPIAWCAPECINFLKFTSASDVWAFGVTIWEMFSYGFQPWAALTGHQILEAIDEQGGQRLEQPVHCPRDYYQLMEACWRHEPSNRPTFAQLLSMLEEARPEQVQVVNPRSGTRHGNLEYEVGDIITVLDKHNVSGDGNSWTGVNSSGKVGRFIPTHTVAYLGTLVPSQASSSWGRGPSVEKEVSSSGTGVFTRAGLRGSKERSSKRKISRDMISGPRGEVQHTGHVGMDGMYFGDVTFIGGTNGTLQITGSRLPSTGSENGFPSLSRADSDVSESAPLLATVPPQPEKPQAPRMGHTIGYLRGNKPSEQPRGEYHQYQSISDEEPEPFGSPLDLGPSLMDEVFGELNSRSTNTMTTSTAPVSLPTEETHKSGGIVDKLADKVSTLTLSRRHKGKKAAFVKPIKASDEKTLDAAIMMANQLASKSMHDLDKRCMDDIFPSPQVSPLTPNSPTKKFTFRFPGPSKGRSTSPKPGSRHFSDEANAHSDLESLVTPTARDAYKVLIEGGESHSPPQSSPAPVPAKPPHRFSLPPTSQVWNTASRMDPPAPCLEPINQDQPEASNPLPLPPKDRKTSVTSGRRHVRKNPLIIPTGAGVARMLQNAEQDVHQPVQQPPKTNYRRPSFPSMREKPFCRDLTPTNDAFEDEIACSIDALDNIPESRYTSPKTSLEHESAPLVQYNQDHVSCEDLLEFSPRSDRGAESDEGRNMKGLGGAGADQCDEVRIMSKVLGGVGADQSTYTAALDLSEWNVHRAIKVVKLRTLVQVPGISDGEMKMALQNRDWDVNKAANDLIKKHRT